MTIFARDADTGMAKWGYQMTPHDAWDYDGVNEMILVDLTMNGQTIPSLVHFDRNGFAYELDRRNGKLLLAKKSIVGQLGDARRHGDRTPRRRIPGT